ncbi:ABC transporter substrate-binding protein [Bradyrhizobium sp. JYMT SZCCT0180]|uniref:ABC transporter substrate-binding protein n=1 Tax=Bradyrhizobium sp. JYMT SZCCT0180 TaxID=2807666 RepID=UPI001BA9FAD6|nr:ABC transporter substrate-binding protein [Bradyrhizobium sp. JYMT SZCCT0180]MBR1209329.1 ABC transporter substrate-binding protein [Bradyrhizobium sp. JYMT SZCCT0180]
MKRREFIAHCLIAAAISICPAYAEKRVLPVIGYLGFDSAEKSTELLVAFREGLRALGFVENQNVAIEYRFAEGKYDRFPGLIANLIQGRVQVIVAATGTNGVLATAAATKTIPIVFAIAMDPVTVGVVSSLNRPGGNATGVSMYTPQLVAKRLELLAELTPAGGTIAMMINPANPNADLISSDAEVAGRSLGRQIHVVRASTDQQIGTAFDEIRERKDVALLVSPDAFYIARREQLAALCEQNRIPAIYEWSLFVKDGGLMSYSPRITDVSRQLGVYAGKILGGAKPADLPVEQPTKFELAINLKAAKAIGLSISPTLLARADEVIE